MQPDVITFSILIKANCDVGRRVLVYAEDIQLEIDLLPEIPIPALCPELPNPCQCKAGGGPEDASGHEGGRAQARRGSTTSGLSRSLKERGKCNFERLQFQLEVVCRWTCRLRS